MAKIAVLVGQLFEDVEFAEPVKAFRKAGHDVVVIGIKAGEELVGERGREKITVDRAVTDVALNEFDALFIPGGYSPDHLRVDEHVLQFVRDFMDSDKPVFAICHAPQLLITAGVIRGRMVTGWRSVIVDIKNAGAEYVDQAVVQDGNLITSRQPGDIPAFVEASLRKLSEVKAQQPAPATR